MIAFIMYTDCTCVINFKYFHVNAQKLVLRERSVGSVEKTFHCDGRLSFITIVQKDFSRLLNSVTNNSLFIYFAYYGVALKNFSQSYEDSRSNGLVTPSNFI